MSRRFDPITLEILWRRLISIVDEADAAVARTAFSSLIRDAHDYSCALFDVEGREIAQATFTTPGQLGGMTQGVKRICRSFDRESFQPGDVLITNDPWLLAGHLPDLIVVTPVFYRGRVVAFAACVFHHRDVGGRLGIDNREVYEEGLFVPLCKLYEAGKENSAIFEIIRANVRLPENTVGDIRSQVAANHVLAVKLTEMMEETGLDDLEGLSEEIIRVSERTMRDGIRDLPAGSYEHESFIEQPGGREPLRVKVRVDVNGSEVVVDFDETSPQVDRGINCVLNFTYAYVFFAIKSAFCPEIPNNDGCTVPVEVRAPEGSILNCKFPVAVTGRTSIGHLLTEVVYQALAKGVPERILAEGGSSPAWWKVISGRRRDGRKFSETLLISGGMGASCRSDGRSCAPFPQNCSNEPVEIMENEAPLLVRKKELICDSGGAGRFRGGLGQELVFEVPSEDFGPDGNVCTTLIAGRFHLPAKGILGGRQGERGAFLLNGEAQDWGVQVFSKPGDVMTFRHPGGGGYGDPWERPWDLVEDDVRNGYVSVGGARRDYGVVVDPRTLRVDAPATEALRTVERGRP
ncbi:MAG: hydantoinase B/oxoprolinase family protein [Deltaproteobacteria bacterium]|nr:hydantoinase B/oxoprolinase family protein [Deltaproteobacteria bacterium]